MLSERAEKKSDLSAVASDRRNIFPYSIMRAVESDLILVGLSESEEASNFFSALSEIAPYLRPYLPIKIQARSRS